MFYRRCIYKSDCGLAFLKASFTNFRSLQSLIVILFCLRFSKTITLFTSIIPDYFYHNNRTLFSLKRSVFELTKTAFWDTKLVSCDVKWGVLLFMNSGCIFVWVKCLTLIWPKITTLIQMFLCWKTTLIFQAIRRGAWLWNFDDSSGRFYHIFLLFRKSC